MLSCSVPFFVSAEEALRELSVFVSPIARETDRWRRPGLCDLRRTCLPFVVYHHVSRTCRLCLGRDGAARRDSRPYCAVGKVSEGGSLLWPNVADRLIRGTRLLSARDHFSTLLRVNERILQAMGAFFVVGG